MVLPPDTAGTAPVWRAEPCSTFPSSCHADFSVSREALQRKVFVIPQGGFCCQKNVLGGFILGWKLPVSS